MESGTDHRATHEWCRQVFRMYCEWATARRMHVVRVADARAELPLLVISGFGSHAVLSEEAGLHVLETEGAGARGGATVNRAVARVRVAATPANASDAQHDFAHLVKLLDASPATSFVVRRYRFEPSPLVRDARRGWRAGRVTEVMDGNFDLFASESTN
jgi:ATP-dependent Clp protease ATP-binding subunit ClpC